MEPIQNQEQLLVRLARNGDPSAFYTLMVSFANAAYVAERNSGKKHGEALSALLPSFKKMYQNFISYPSQSTFKEWYKEQEKKYLPASQEVSIESLNEAGLKNLLTADIIHFDWALNLVLQRHYGKFRRAKKRGAVIGPLTFFKRGNWFFKIALFAGFIALFLAGSYAYLVFSKKQFAVSFGPAQAMHSIAFPSTAHNFFQVNSVSGSNAQARENSLSETLSSQPSLLHDTIKIHDTIRIFNRAKSSASGTPGTSPNGLPASQNNLHPALPASSTIKTSEGGKPGSSLTITKTNSAATPAGKKLLSDSLK